MPNAAKKILILYTSVGLGHKSMAENIGFYLERGGMQVQLHDIYKLQNGFLGKFGKWLYALMLNHAPWIWDFMHNATWFVNLFVFLRLPLASFNYRNVLGVIKQFEPDVIISSHNACSTVVSYIKHKGLYTGLFGITFSDYFLHKFWLFDNADFYLANIEEQKHNMLLLGVPESKIFVCGMLPKPKPEVNVGLIKEKFGIKAEEKVVLLASGSQGTGVDEELISQFNNHQGVRIIVLCGKNTKLKEILNKKFINSSSTILGYYSPMDELYAIADIFISKPGGLSVAEALWWRLPILVSHLLPGGEPYNYKYLLANKLVMPKTDDLTNAAFNELATGDFKKSLSQNPNLQKLFLPGEAVASAVASFLVPRQQPLNN